MTNNLNSINSIETTTDSNKSSKFLENTKRAVRDVLIKTGIVVSTMTPMSTASSTTMPTSLNTITQTTPLNDYTEYTIESEQSEIDITGGETKNTEVGNGYTSETRADNQNNNIEYKSIEINSINPVDILPIIGQIEAGDKQAYEHIEHLRIAEATRIRDMMREYGAGNHSPQEYQQLMNRLNTGMTMENPKGFDNFEAVGGEFAEEPSNHAHDERDILNTLINHANFKVVNPVPANGSRIELLQEEVNQNTNNIYIFGNSSYATYDKETFGYIQNDNTIRNLCKSRNFLIFAAGGNINKKNGILKNQILHKDVDGDEHGVYSLPSFTNGRNDSNIDIHLIVSIGTDANGDIDQTKEKYESSRYPVGFNNNTLFAGRTFPRHKISTGEIAAETGKYPTSYVNYTNVAVADLCFQMFAEVENIDELLNMIRNSTDLRDHIRFDLNGDGDTNDTHNGQPESQPLILMNPAGFFQKYLMPSSLPTNLKTDETIALNKGYYHGVIYQVPGAEVNINGQWIAFTDDNKNIILSQNPMNLEWRLNGELLNSYNYKPGDTISGQILVVDDNWDGLNISKDFSFTVDNPNSINAPVINSSNNTWYTINGYRLDKKPTKPGIYIVNGQKVIIK